MSLSSGGDKKSPYSAEIDKAVSEFSGDAFGRLRVSGTGQRLDAEFLYDKQVDLFDETTTNGTVTHNGNPRDLTLSLSDANNGSFAKMASYPVPYTPGNSQLVDLTGVLDLAGIGGGTAEVFLRSNVSGTPTDVETVTQDNWEVFTNSADIDWTDSHIFGIDFQSLKVGSIRFYLVDNGVPRRLTTIHNNNKRNTGYWQLANLPAYWHLYTAGGITYMEMGYGDANNAVGIRYRITANASATMKAICTTVKSEGGEDLADLEGLPFTADNGTTAVTASTTLVPILSIRPKTTFETFPNLALALPKSFTIEVDNPVRVVVIVGGTLGGGGTSWADVETNGSKSMLEQDVGSTTITGGKEIFSDYVTTTAKNAGNSAGGLLGKAVLWNRQSSETGIMSICAIRTTATDADCKAAIRGEEFR